MCISEASTRASYLILKLNLTYSRSDNLGWSTLIIVGLTPGLVDILTRISTCVLGDLCILRSSFWTGMETQPGYEPEIDW